MSLEDRIKEHEGCRLTPYRDSLGILTVGYGRNLQDVPFTQEEVDFMFATDYQRAVNAAESFPAYAGLDPVRAGVVVEMCFQMGRAGVAKFRRMWAAIDRGDFGSAAEEMLDSQWHEQTPGRAKELAQLMREGE